MMRHDLHPAAGPSDPGCLCRLPARRPMGPYAMSYFATTGPTPGRIRGRRRLVAGGALGAPDDRARVGVALADGRADYEVEVWALTIHGVELPGKWVVVDREFRPAQ